MIIISLLIRLIGVYSWILIVYAIMSWFPQLAYSSFGRFISKLVEPYLSIFSKIPTKVGVFDFKIVLGYIGLLVLQRFLAMVFFR